MLLANPHTCAFHGSGLSPRRLVARTHSRRRLVAGTSSWFSRGYEFFVYSRVRVLRLVAGTSSSFIDESLEVQCRSIDDTTALYYYAIYNIYTEFVFEHIILRRIYMYMRSCY